MATQDLKINFDHIMRIKEYNRNSLQQAYDERFYAVKTNFEHYGRILCNRMAQGHANITGIVKPNIPIVEPGLLQKIILELKFRLKSLTPTINPYYKTNKFKSKFKR